MEIRFVSVTNQLHCGKLGISANWSPLISSFEYTGMVIKDQWPAPFQNAGLFIGQLHCPGKNHPYW